ncbi:SNF-related serine/threonine-protein kinase-like [Dendronephthya gigantea]|uniref:SNF-related serine/threonine-protein kinase-like n=1 Tax=Dendronephthya gigantea TaxID=151771 RepID=UPI00106BCA0C|nr:SNF-related serine/threonine-protein kinase-like [Dendronephthya gigantea]XP_028409963.1 SNF-related serine/threonine-protein kinase-like [Dendronephthya gigantea]XP_028409964.1 SNF-related serine/threonine-protein kinase-like [Dendronephthya gigantea]
MARFTRQPRRNETKIAGMYDLEERLGSGHFAEVKLARHVFTGERVAVKVIDKLKLDETAKHHLYQEVRCMKLVQHPNIVRLYEVIDTNTKLYLVQEFGDGGDMYDYIMKHESGMSEEKARRYFRQILQAIDYCHRLYVVHRDLKPENVIFFKKSDVAKLTDFGFSNKFLPGTKLQTACGSLAYSAPEILLGDSYDAPAVDVWSLGVILYMMVVGKAPFYEANESETLTMILDCKFHIPDHVSQSCQSLITRMIVRDACKRSTLADILDDPWVHGDHGPVAVTSVPLANQVEIGVDHHNEIVQKMKLGDIADQETINKCLESGSYNHVSATYYLLAEQILRRWHRAKSSSSLSSTGPDAEVKSHVIKRQSMPPQRQKPSLSDVSGNQNLCVPYVDDRPLSDGNEGDELEDIDMNLLTSKIRYHSTESIYDKKSDEHDQEEIVGSVSVAVTTNQRKSFQKRLVAKVKSTPAFLNQISEERESDLDDSPRASPRVRRSSRRPFNVIQKTRRPSPASSSAGRRSSSHSSSSEDDGDLDKKMRRLSTERCRRSPKRRSDDEGDGDDGDGGTKGPHGIARKRMMAAKPEQAGGNKDTSSESGNTSSEQGKTAQLKLQSELLKDKLLNVYIKLNEEQNTNSVVDGTVAIETPMVCLDNKETETLFDKQQCKPHFIIDGAYGENLKASIENTSNGEKVIVCSQDNSQNDRILKSEDEINPENMLVDSDIPIPSKECSQNTDDSTNDLENTAITSQEQFQISNENFEEVGSARTINDQSVDSGNASKEKQEMSLICESKKISGIKNTDVSSTDDAVVSDGIIEIIKHRTLTNETLENFSDKENIDISGKETMNCPNGEPRRVTLRGSDIEDIEMFMKNKDTGHGLELDPDVVRNIFNNSKVSRVTSNCCQII